MGAADLRGKLSLVETVQQGLDLIDAAIEKLAHGYEIEEETVDSIALV